MSNDFPEMLGEMDDRKHLTTAIKPRLTCEAVQWGHIYREKLFSFCRHTPWFCSVLFTTWNECLYPGKNMLLEMICSK